MPFPPQICLARRIAANVAKLLELLATKHKV
jgi:hypothetical protein